jgi:O-antigen ligase
MHPGSLSGSSIGAKLRACGAVFACAGCFFTPLSTSLLGLFSVLAALAWLLSGGLFDLPQILRNHHSTLCALALFCLMALALSYSEAEPIQALDTLKKYRELLLLPVFMGLFSLSARYRTWAEYAFLSGCVVLMLVSYLMFFHLVPEERYGHSMVFHITHSFFMAILSFWTLHKALTRSSGRSIWLVIFLAAVINIFYIAPGRTGMFVFCCLMLLFFYQQFSLGKWLLCMMLFVAFIGVIYQSSDNFSGRVKEAIDEVNQYQPGQSRTSIGQRFDWWNSSIALIKQKPLLGHGTGSFPLVHQKIIENTSVAATDNPHNEYLLISVQFGLIGLGLFFCLILLQLIEANRLDKPPRCLLQGVILAILAGSMMNSLLFDSQQGHFYLFMSCALLAGGEPRRKR